MSQSGKIKDPLRYRAYFWLMNLSLFFIFIGLVELGIRLSQGVRVFGMPDGLDVVIGALVTIFGYLIPPILIIAKPMRDEYAELLWKRTVAHLVSFVAIVPPLIIIGLWVAYALVGGETRPDWLAWLYDAQRPVGLLLWVWTTFIVLFVMIFQFLRWRDSR